MKNLFTFIKKTKKLKTKLKNFGYLIDIVELSRFSLIGVFSTFINFLFFIISKFLFSAGLMQSVIIGYLFGFISSFYFGRAWILSPRYKFKMTTFFKFVLLKFILLLKNTTLLYSIIAIYVTSLKLYLDTTV